MKYILTKTQIKRLIDGKHVTDSRGKKIVAGDNVKEVLRKLDELNLYDTYDAIIENGSFDLVKKAV